MPGPQVQVETPIPAENVVSNNILTHADTSTFCY